MKAQRAMAILWPSFLVAVLAEGFFFSLFAPHELISQTDSLELTPIAVYTLGFFCFWLFCSLASMLTYYLTEISD